MADSVDSESKLGQLPDGGVALAGESNGGDENLDTNRKMDPLGPRKRSRSQSKETEITETKRQKGVAPIKAEYVRLIAAHFTLLSPEKVSATSTRQQGRRSKGRR
jgi:hypothetical protein